jgi:hydroxybutyrate-dimer hydrolase
MEVTNAQHFDGFIGLPAVLPGYDSRYVPLHVYLNRALDAVYDHLKNGKRAAASQVVRTVPRGGTAGPGAGHHRRQRAPSPPRRRRATAITIDTNTVVVPD